MAALYRLDAAAADVARHFAARAGEDPWDGGAIAPGQFAPVITTGRDAIAGPRGGAQPRRMVPRLWGVPPPPAADPRATVATVSNVESPFWIGNLRNSEFRCLVPATAWIVRGKGRDAQGRPRQVHVGVAGGALFAFAGVWKDSEIPSFALLTCDANAALQAEGVARMPVILPADPDATDTWLSRGWDRASRLVRAHHGVVCTGVDQA